MSLQAKNVQVIGTELAIQWTDGSEAFLPLDAMRRACPCAGCIGEPDFDDNMAPPEKTYTSSSSRMRSFQFIGGYALQPVWEDGHRTGIYSFDYLKQLEKTLAAEGGNTA